jgi:hypothetical protein
MIIPYFKAVFKVDMNTSSRDIVSEMLVAIGL